VGSDVGILKEPPVFFDANILDRIWKDVECVGEARVWFHYQLGRETAIRWRGHLFQYGRLVVDIPHGCMPEGTKEGFIALMEFAEEKLGCTEILVRFSKERQDRAGLIRTFMYFGFQMLAPNNTQLDLWGMAQKHFLLICKI